MESALRRQSCGAGQALRRRKRCISEKSAAPQQPELVETDAAKDKKGEEPEVEKIRIQKLLADAGYCSRRQAEQLISAGKVKLNGHPVKAGGQGNAGRPDYRQR